MKDKYLETFLIGILCGIVACLCASCTTVKIVHQRPTLRRIEAQVFTDEKKLYIYTTDKQPNFWKP